MVRTASGRALFYDRLVLATGSRPFLPPIEGATLDNVFVYRSVEHIHALRAAMSRSKRAAVIGGGLLGLEVAHALHHAGLETHIVEHGSGLLARQLPPAASALLQLQIESLGLHVHLNCHTTRIVADGSHRFIEFTDGPGLATDVVVITAGIRPRDELASAAGLALGPRGGIVVDDFLRTSDPRIHAIGECAIHNGRHYGFAAPGFRMADVLASNFAGSRKRFTGADLSSKLKLPGITVANLGEFQANAGALTFQNATTYRQLILRRNRVVGAITVGDWPELNRIQEAIDSGRRLWKLQLARFERGGTLWPERDFVDVAQWPAGALVCHCMKVKRGILSQAVARGCDSVEGLAQATGASTVCGSCKPLLGALVGARASLQPAKGWKTLIGASAIALLLALLIAFAGPVPITESVQTGWRIEALWRDAFWKQTTGYTLLGLCLASLGLSLRKRIKRFALGNFAGWRAIPAAFHHVVGDLPTDPAALGHALEAAAQRVALEEAVPEPLRVDVLERAAALGALAVRSSATF
jgi:nitrite reductase (NADH) large subunit